MSSFLIAAAALTALAWAMLWPAMRSRSAGPSAATSASQSNLNILREQLGALDAELAAGSLDTARHHAARIDIERRVLEEEAPAPTVATSAATAPTAAAKAHHHPQRHSTTTRALLCAGIAACAFGLYAALGNPAGLAVASAPSATAPADDVTPEAMQAMLADMEKRLDHQPAQPDDLQGWTMLARSYAALQMFDKASRAFARASALAPTDAQLIADHADVLAMAQGQQTSGEPARLIAQALQLDPNNLKALALAGSVAFERKDYATAIQQWGKARELAPVGSEFASGLDRSLAEARAAGGLAPSNAAAAGTGTVAAAAAGTAAVAAAAERTAAASQAGRITGRVQLAPDLAAKVAPGDTLFIFARAAQGPRMPLAIVRLPVGAWPVEFQLDDTQAMSPETKLSKFDQVIVGARISRSGNAMPQPGDLSGQGAVISSSASGVLVTIDRVQP
ncbi:c-type cytochrome biogenesis protein CcmI [soil metagenome]